jgi:hypothetical protein
MSGGGATTTAADMAEAAKVRHGEGDALGPSTKKSLPRRVIVDEGAVQKYVLVQAKLSPPVYFVRGNMNAT